MDQPPRPTASSSTRSPSPQARADAPGTVARFLFPETTADHQHPTYAWYRVLWLTGVDYFSTLGYQPAIAFVAAGALAPVATLILLVVTLFGALPVYAAVARRSYAGQGSIAMLERLVPGWMGKIFVLALLGFAATDFVITMTLSAADAAQHAAENPLLHGALGDHRLAITCALLALLAAVFLVGFKEALGVAALICVPYLALNVVVIVRGFHELAVHPELIRSYRAALAAHGDVTSILLASALVFPRLALGMSGFETGVSLMPLVRGAPDDGAPPAARVRNTRFLLAAAAAIMCVMLATSSLVTSALIPAHEFARGGKADGRALAYLAHALLGDGFGTVYDAATIVILWFAGASAMAAMLNLIPRYLPRFGMAPRWVAHPRPLVLVLFVVNIAVTWAFQADVEAQGGAYATGVLVLMLSAAVAVTLAAFQEARSAERGRAGRAWARGAYFSVISLVLAFTLIDNIIFRHDGVIIAGLFTLAILLISALSRYRRATELRVETLGFVDQASEDLWRSLRGKKVNLVPIGASTAEGRAVKADRLRRDYRAEAPIAFVHVDLADDTSEFASRLRVRITREDDAYLLAIDGAVSIANTLAWVSEQIDPIGIYLDLSLENPVSQALKYLLWGEGEIGVLVYEILVRYWHSTPEDDVRPLIFLVSR
ncbi:MAG: hypothetical protein ABJE95_11940 [Byssovorax sp.]